MSLPAKELNRVLSELFLSTPEKEMERNMSWIPCLGSRGVSSDG